MSYSIAFTASSPLESMLYGGTAAGIGAASWLGGHYVTSAAHMILNNVKACEGRLAKIGSKLLQAIITLGELIKFTCLYVGGIGCSIAAASAFTAGGFSAFSIVLFGSSFAAIYALSQTKQNLSEVYLW